MARSKVNSRSHLDVAHLHSLTNVPTKYQLPTLHGFRDIARTRFYRSRSLQQCQRSHHDVTHLHLLTNIPNTALKVSRSLDCLTTSISHGVENYFPRLWGMCISDAIFKRPMRDACLHMGGILVEGSAGSASLPTYSVFTSGWNFFKLGTYI